MHRSRWWTYFTAKPEGLDPYEKLHIHATLLPSFPVAEYLPTPVLQSVSAKNL